MRAVSKTASLGTRRVFRSIRCKKQAFLVRKRYSVPKTASLGTRRVFRGPRCMKPPPAVRKRIFSARNGLREEAGKHKKRVLIKVYQDFLDPRIARTVAAACRILRRRCLFQKKCKKEGVSQDISKEYTLFLICMFFTPRPIRP